nr:hypothetical protein [Tanacetum cinerariifolium]
MPAGKGHKGTWGGWASALALFSEAFRRWCTALLSTFYPSMMLESSLGDSSERPRHSSSLSAGPSFKICMSPTDSVPSSTPVTGSLAPTCADLLPSQTEDGRELAIIDGDDVRDQVEVDPRDDREEFEASTGDTVVLGIDPRSVPRFDEEIVKPVGGDSSSSSGTRDGTVRSVKDISIDLDGAIHNFYHLMSKVRVDRIVGIKTAQRRLEADQIASGARASMVESIRSLRLENLKIHDDRNDLWRSLRMLESFAERQMINRRVTKALEAHEINRNLGLENLNGNGNDGNGNKNGNRRNGNEPGGDENGNRGNDNGHGGNGNGNEGNGNEQGGNRNGDGNGDRPVARKCTYQDFIKCQPLDFKGTEGVVGLIRWCEKMETLFHISNFPKRYQVKELMKLITKVYFSRNKIQKMETELWNLTVKNSDMDTYTQRFQELTMMCTKMVPEEEDRVEKFIG